MNRRQKSALRSTHIKLADELILDEDFYAALRQNKIFTDGMMALIKEEKKPRDRVYKMLELLEKRGPKAFENFVWILKENYEWLADMLEEEYERRRQPAETENQCPVRTTAGFLNSETKYFAVDGHVRHDAYRVYSAYSAVGPRTNILPPVQASYPGISFVDGAQPPPFAAFHPGNSQHVQYMPHPQHHQHPNPQQHHQNYQHPNYQHHPNQQNPNARPHQIAYDSTDHLTVSVTTNNNHTSSSSSSDTRKQYKDACMSPIGIIEIGQTGRKLSDEKLALPGPGACSGLGSATRNEDKKSMTTSTEVVLRKSSSNLSSSKKAVQSGGQGHSGGSGHKTADPGFDELRSIGTNGSNGESNNADNDAVDGYESVCIGIDGALKEGSGNSDQDLEGDEDDDDAFPSSEVYYEHVRRGSSCLPPLPDEVLLALEGRVGGDKVGDGAGTGVSGVTVAGDDDFDDDMNRTESSLLHHNTEFVALLEGMKDLYFRLITINSHNDDIEEDGENIVTWEMIDIEVDKLAQQLTDSDDSKMIKKCYALLAEKERRLPLNRGIETIIHERKESQDRLSEKRKEIDTMVYDMWNHQQDMKNIEKLKKLKNNLQEENIKLKGSLDDIGVCLDQERLAVVQKDLKIQELENKVRELEDKCKSPRRPAPTMQRRPVNATVQMAANRRGVTSGQSGVSLLQQSGYNTSAQVQSPRTMSTNTAAAAARRNTISRR